MPEGSTERRLAVIVAIEVAGYARLIRADEAGILAALKGHREACHQINVRHGGRFVGAAGDGYFLEFPSVTEAVDYSVETIALMVERNAGVPVDKRILFNIGIEHGEILIDGLDFDGDAVKVAARLQALAEFGDICISGTVRDNLGDRMDIKFDDIGEAEVKNIARPVQAFRVLADGEEAGQSSLKPSRPKRQIAVAAIGLVVLLVGAGLVWWW